MQRFVRRRLRRSARWTGAHGGHAFFAYSSNYLIDTSITAIAKPR
jgi:hypothetical protein